MESPLARIPLCSSCSRHLRSPIFMKLVPYAVKSPVGTGSDDVWMSLVMLRFRPPVRHYDPRHCLQPRPRLYNVLFAHLAADPGSLPDLEHVVVVANRKRFFACGLWCQRGFLRLRLPVTLQMSFPLLKDGSWYQKQPSFHRYCNFHQQATTRSHGFRPRLQSRRIMDLVSVFVHQYNSDCLNSLYRLGASPDIFGRRPSIKGSADRLEDRKLLVSPCCCPACGLAEPDHRDDGQDQGNGHAGKGDKEVV